uniref:Transformation/transcription domain-associated protein n=1 Tax=Branchiostoma floridae TaxID=7739 RepID=C3ZR49_BRAFL|eukprot:XP_002588911.1 hypothetical protein BRAFLDRAFT_89099 [Branchiostoma floridae]
MAHMLQFEVIAMPFEQMVWFRENWYEEMVWFRENWYEEVSQQLQQGLAKCYSVAFENRTAVSEAKITPHTLNFVKKLVSTFGVGVESVTNVSSTFSSAASESLARRAQQTSQDPVFQRMKTQFTTDFDFSVPGSMKLHNLISKLKKWIKILEARTKLMPKSFLIEEKCRFLSNFSMQTAEVEIPGEFLLPKHNHYYIKIAKFLPRVEIVHKHGTAARRLYIRGHNGKIYPYLVMNDACLSDSRREERVLQLLRMLNHFLEKRKETARRNLQFTVPRVVAVSPQMRLVEDNPSSLSLLSIYKQLYIRAQAEIGAPNVPQHRDLDANRPVPFRLTPNISDFLTPIGVSGVLTSCMIAAARCFVQPNFKLDSLLRAVLRDELIYWHKKKQDEQHMGSTQPQDMDGEVLITMVNKAVNAIMTRLQNLAQFEGGESKVSTLVAAANSPDNLCRMDPAWHPWL